MVKRVIYRYLVSKQANIKFFVLIFDHRIGIRENIFSIIQLHLGIINLSVCASTVHIGQV